MLSLTRNLLFGAIVAVAAAQVPAAQPPVYAGPELRTRGEIVYITGGIGADERDRLKKMEKEFNLRLLFTQPDGHLLSDASVVVKDASGQTVLAEQSGPIFLAKLPPGTYTVETAFDGKKQTRRVTVGKKLTTARFTFRDVTGDVALR
jgi:hypothetical protein